MVSADTADALAIVAEGASKLFLDGAVVAFHQLSFQVRRNEIMCVVGPSGCGKTRLVRALAMNPSILLMDEPFAALDAQTREILQEELLALMQRPDERKTMVFITHSIDEAIVLGDRITVMSARPGRIKEVLDMPFGWPRDVDAV